ncbi:DNA-binding protein [Halobacteriales archaeon QH_10_67_13]|nr:MAG: DNA-binding protein [Halobacteriales archaeon QH_10_67_13]
MKLIEEVVVEEFLPTFRSLLAAELDDRGLTQDEIAAQLGISQSAVSKHVHGDIDRTDRIAEDDRVRTLVTELGERLATGELTDVEAVLETEACIRELEQGGVLAELHAAGVPGLDPDTPVHGGGERLRETVRVRRSVRRGVNVLRSADAIAELIPDVGANVVEATADAETIDDVAAVPGRLFAVRGRLAVPDDPAFGVSQHVAGLLLAARAAGHDARAAVCVGYSPALVETLVADGHVAVEFAAEEEIEPAVRAALADRLDADVLYQAGGFGVEPVAYVLGPDAPTVARVVRACLD